MARHSPQTPRPTATRPVQLPRIHDRAIRAITALAIGNVGKRRDAVTGGHATGGHAAGGQAAGEDATGDCCDSRDKQRSHDTSRIAWGKLMARVGEEFPLK
ncbi:MAG: hypothetical protein WCQ77_14195 [Planctomycetota bacterium]